jgi:hypothetical protein
MLKIDAFYLSKGNLPQKAAEYPEGAHVSHIKMYLLVNHQFFESVTEIDFIIFKNTVQ